MSGVAGGDGGDEFVLVQVPELELSLQVTESRQTEYITCKRECDIADWQDRRREQLLLHGRQLTLTLTEWHWER